jgi:hypothetical protein
VTSRSSKADHEVRRKRRKQDIMKLPLCNMLYIRQKLLFDKDALCGCFPTQEVVKALSKLPISVTKMALPSGATNWTHNFISAPTYLFIKSLVFKCPLFPVAWHLGYVLLRKAVPLRASTTKCPTVGRWLLALLCSGLHVSWFLESLEGPLRPIFFAKQKTSKQSA